MEVDQNSSSRGDGFKSYYTTKIEELLLVVAEKSMNLRRLQAQRNELNAKGDLNNIFLVYNLFISYQEYKFNKFCYKYFGAFLDYFIKENCMRHKMFETTSFFNVIYSEIVEGRITIASGAGFICG